MRVGFMGTSVFAVVALEKLLTSGHEVVYIVTQPDRPKGRGKKYQMPPVKEAALAAGREVLQPKRIREPEAVTMLTAIPVDVIVVAAYGQIIPQAILEHPAYGCLNIHGSLLPEYRGAAPIQRAIMEGKTETGVTIMYMNAGLDTGDMISRKVLTIGEDENYGELQQRMAELGAEELLAVLQSLEQGTVIRTPQTEETATYAARLESNEEKVDWNRPAAAIHCQIRALAPEPGAYTLWNGKRFKLLASHVAAETGSGTPGTVTEITANGFLVQASPGVLEIRTIQKEGKNRMAAADFTRGVKSFTGTVLGE